MLRRLCLDWIGRKECRGSYKQQRGKDPFHAQNKRLALRHMRLIGTVSMK